MNLRIALSLTLSGLALQAAAQEVPPPIAPETLTVEATIAEGPNVFAVDSSWTGASNVFILGLDDFAMKGNVSPGMQALLTVNAAGTSIFTASNYNTRIVYGDTTSIVHEFDVETASIVREIEIPAKLAMMDVQPGLLRLTADERYLLAQNATPATSVSVVDLQTGEFLVEIPTPGCFIILPAPEGNAFTTICGDGTFQTHSWDEDGTLGEPVRSAVIFDPDEDPIFTNPAFLGDTMVFASYNGNLYVVSNSAEGVVLEDVLAMTEGVDGDWGVSGSEVIGGHEGTGVVFVLMHSGRYDGSHKDPSEEIWAYDVASQELLYRSNSLGEGSLTVAQGEVPMIYTTGDSELHRYEVDPTARFAARVVATSTYVGSISLIVTNE